MPDVFLPCLNKDDDDDDDDDDDEAYYLMCLLREVLMVTIYPNYGHTLTMVFFKP